MRVLPELITPSQDFLKPSTVEFIFKCIENNDLDRLPPDPIVRHDAEGRLVAIDGHNLIAVALYKQEEIQIHVADSAADGLPPLNKANIQRNKDLQDKFELVILERERLRSKGITSFRDLLKRYPELFP